MITSGCCFSFRRTVENPRVTHAGFCPFSVSRELSCGCSCERGRLVSPFLLISNVVTLPLQPYFPARCFIIDVCVDSCLGGRGGGWVSCALWDVWQHPCLLPTRRQSPPPPRCDHPSRLQTLPSVPWGTGSPHREPLSWSPAAPWTRGHLGVAEMPTPEPAAGQLEHGPSSSPVCWPACSQQCEERGSPVTCSPSSPTWVWTQVTFPVADAHRCQTLQRSKGPKSLYFFHAPQGI